VVPGGPPNELAQFGQGGMTPADTSIFGWLMIGSQGLKFTSNKEEGCSARCSVNRESGSEGMTDE